MISVVTLYNRINDIAKKDQKGYITEDEFNRALYSVQLELFEYFNSSSQRNKRISDALVPFSTSENITIGENGCGKLPDNYGHWQRVLWMEIKNGNEQCKGVKTEVPSEYLRDNEVGDICASIVRKPSKEKRRIYHSFCAGEICVYPKDIDKVELKYYRIPKEAKIVLKLESNNGEDYEVVDETNSVDLEWNEVYFTTFIRKLLEEVGIEIKDSELIQYGNMVKNEGVLLNA